MPSRDRGPLYDSISGSSGYLPMLFTILIQIFSIVFAIIFV